MTKQYLSMYYGIDYNLPDKIFYDKIKEINKLALFYANKFNRKEKSYGR